MPSAAPPQLLPWAAALAVATSAGSAMADLGKNGSRIETSDYTIDLYEGPILAGARVIGLGGAYAPIAEGIAGYGFNPAAAAQRVPWSTSWFDWELDGGVTLPSSIVNTDFDNNGDDGFTNRAAIFLTGGLGFQFGDLGVGATLDVNQYKVGARTGDKGDLLNVNFVHGLIVAAYSLLDGEIIVGLGLGGYSVEINQPAQEGGSAQEQKIVSVAAGAVHAGALWAPAWLPLRVGASVRYSPANPDAAPEVVNQDAVKQENGNYILNDYYYLPRTISLPTEIHAGVAVQLFRPMNLRWVNPHDEDSAVRRAQRDLAAARERREEEAERRKEALEGAGKDDEAREAEIERLEQEQAREEERAEAQAQSTLASARQADRIRRRAPYERMPREKLLVSAAVKVTTKTEDGVGLESFLTQRVERSGTTISYSPRVGVEGELIPGYLVLRAGSYYEPTRFGTRSTFRVHGTGGLDVHIPIAWSVFGLLDKGSTFRVGGAVDGALRYFGWGVTAGLWH